MRISRRNWILLATGAVAAATSLLTIRESSPPAPELHSSLADYDGWIVTVEDKRRLVEIRGPR